MKDIDDRKRDKNTQEEVRLFVVKSVAEGIMSQVEIARFYKVSEGAVYGWFKKYRYRGEARLEGNKRGSVKKKNCSPPKENISKLKYLINSICLIRYGTEKLFRSLFGKNIKLLEH